ncbi:MAG: hypothetical protein ACFHWX_08485 [Bacteroidota bacterium]
MINFYKQRIQFLKTQLETESKSANNLSLIRGIIFLMSFLCFVAFATTLKDLNWTLLFIAGIIGLIFYRVVLVHIQKIKQVEKLKSLIHLNQDEVDRLDLNLEHIENGEGFIKPDHPYHIDLDIFGNHSLYQLINRCQIPESKQLLADWLSNKASIEEISLRQEATKELASDLEWNQHFLSTAYISLNKRGKRAPEVSQLELIAWANKEYELKYERIWKPITVLTTIVSVSLLLTVIFTNLPSQLLYLLIIPNGLLLFQSVKHLKALSQDVDKANYLVSTFLNTLPLIENASFKSKRLIKLKEKLGKAVPASKAIKKLSNITYRLSVRGNILYPILDGLFLVDAYLLIDLYNWKKQYKQSIHEWLEVVNEMECLISLAGFSQLNPKYIFPEVHDQLFQFEATNLGHPLISPEEMVVNDYSIKGKGAIDILTGSNMSGKSTFERTVAINMVLAQMGAPVYATSLSMGLTEIFTSMRTIDNIAEHTSSFYAELKRINRLLEYCKEHPATFVVIDEVLKGTNSEDRHIGAMALVKKITGLSEFGIISTHDLALGKETTGMSKIRNFSFNSEIIDDQIQFDYKLTPGLCKSFNASKLMEKMGITN